MVIFGSEETDREGERERERETHTEKRERERERNTEGGVENEGFKGVGIVAGTGFGVRGWWALHGPSNADVFRGSLCPSSILKC